MIRLLLLITLVFICKGCKKDFDHQDVPCEYYFESHVDEFENNTYYKSRTIVLNENSKIDIGSIYFFSIDLKTFHIKLILDDSLCIIENTKVIFLFDDSSTIEYNNISDLNCESKIILKNIVTSDFINKRLKGFRIKFESGYIDYYIDSSSGSVLLKNSKCFFDLSAKNINN